MHTCVPSYTSVRCTNGGKNQAHDRGWVRHSTWANAWVCRARNTALSNCLLPCRPPFDPSPSWLRFLETAAPPLLPSKPLSASHCYPKRSASLISCFPFIHPQDMCVSTIAMSRYHEYCTWPSCLAPPPPPFSASVVISAIYGW